MQKAAAHAAAIRMVIRRQLEDDRRMLAVAAEQPSRQVDTKRGGVMIAVSPFVWMCQHDVRIDVVHEVHDRAATRHQSLSSGPVRNAEGANAAWRNADE